MSNCLFVHDDARRLPIDPKSIDAIVTDPPYGINWNTDYTRFSDGNGKQKSLHNQRKVQNDDRPFDPSPWIEFKRVIMFGANLFSDRLPLGSWLVWDKRFENGASWLADAEMAWMNKGHGTYIFHETSQGGTFPDQRCHPTQKPVSVIRWCIQKLKLKPNSLIVDPYCGSGSTAIAAEQEGHRFIGLDLDREYLKIAWTRYHRPHKHIPRPGRPENHPLFDRLAD